MMRGSCFSELNHDFLLCNEKNEGDGLSCMCDGDAEHENNNYNQECSFFQDNEDLFASVAAYICSG